MEFLKKANSKKKEINDNEIFKIVNDIINDIRNNGDNALKKYNKKFDKCNRNSLRVTKNEILEAYSKLSLQEISDFKIAIHNIRLFAKKQMSSIKSINNFSPMPGIYLNHRIIPIESCCCYVPGGNYPLYSTALMLIITAKVAGVSRIVACTPVIKGTKKINPKTLVAMDIAGANEIYAIGGVQAIAAFSYGTKRIKSVNKIVGPGNRFVTEAKRQCYGKVGIDFIAGPSEILIVSDNNCNYKIIAADLLAQSEHDINAKSILITTNKLFGIKVIKAIEKELGLLKTSNIARKSWNMNGEIIFTSNFEEIINIVNKYAPEHLELNIKNYDMLIKKIYNYGSMFIGENSAEVFGDYISGTNHTLPTLKSSRYIGGVWVGSFLKICTQQIIKNIAIKNIAPIASRLANGEGLEAHKYASDIRYKKNN